MSLWELILLSRQKSFVHVIYTNLLQRVPRPFLRVLVMQYISGAMNQRDWLARLGQTYTCAKDQLSCLILVASVGSRLNLHHLYHFFQYYSLQYKVTRLVPRLYILLRVGLVRETSMETTIVGISMEMPSFTMTVPVAK